MDFGGIGGFFVPPLVPYTIQYQEANQSEHEPIAQYVFRVIELRTLAGYEGYIDSDVHAAQLLRDGVVACWKEVAREVFDELVDANSRKGINIDYGQFTRRLIWAIEDKVRLQQLADDYENQANGREGRAAILEQEATEFYRRGNASKRRATEERRLAKRDREAARMHREEAGLPGGPVESDPSEERRLFDVESAAGGDHRVRFFLTRLDNDNQEGQDECDGPPPNKDEAGPSRPPTRRGMIKP